MKWGEPLQQCCSVIFLSTWIRLLMHGASLGVMQIAFFRLDQWRRSMLLILWRNSYLNNTSCVISRIVLGTFWNRVQILSILLLRCRNTGGINILCLRNDNIISLNSPNENGTYLTVRIGFTKTLVSKRVWVRNQWCRSRADKYTSTRQIYKTSVDLYWSNKILHSHITFLFSN